MKTFAGSLRGIINGAEVLRGASDKHRRRRGQSMFKEDVVEKEINQVTVVPKEFVKSIFYSAVIHFINHSLKLPAVFSVVPLMILSFLIILFTREWNNKKRQYAFLIPYVAEYFGFCLYFYNGGKLMPITAACMAVILAVWGVFCIECVTKNKKRLVIGLLVFAIVTAGSELLIWSHYSAKAQAAVQKIKDTPRITEEFITETDDICQELNVVFYQKNRLNFRLKEIVTNELVSREEREEYYQEFRENLSKADGKWISSLIEEEIELSKKLENFD